MAEVFAWPVRTGVSGGGEFLVSEARFGDGYVQTSPDGLNNESQSWPIAIVGRQEKVGPVLEFIRAHQGGTSFLWTPPLGVQGLYLCKTYEVLPHGGGVYTLSATFEQTFQP